MKIADQNRNFELKMNILRAAYGSDTVKLSALAKETSVGKKKLCELAEGMCAASLIESVGEYSFARPKSVCLVLLRIYRDLALLTFCRVGGNESIELRAVPALSDDDNVARYLSVVERACFEIREGGERVLAVASLVGVDDDLLLPSNLSCACCRRDAIARYLEIVGERRTTLYISLSNDRSFESLLFHNAEFVGNGAATGVFDASSLCAAFNFLKPERLIVQSNRAIAQEAQIREICKARRIETDFFCGKELTPEEQGMTDILLECDLRRSER